MNGKKYDILKKCVLICIMIFAVTVTACGREDSEIKDYTENEIPEAVTKQPEENADVDYSDGLDENGADIRENEEAAVDTVSDAAKEEELKKRFGENCIAGQTFEVTLSEYEGKVWFVPFYPSEDEEEFSMKIIRDGEVLTNIHGFVPENLEGQTFCSLDAVSFFDADYDGDTDIVLIETYGNTTFASVYYGFGADAEEYERYFDWEEGISERVSEQVEVLTIPQIRSFLTEGKENGKFSGYEEAYEAVSRICALESGGEMQYNLIYFNDDDIPELAAGVSGYYTTLYTYCDGTLYKVMDRWSYGAMGNAGYEYSPGKNSLRNYNNDYAGAIMYTTYMTMSDRYSMDTVVQIVTYNFDDVNQNGQPDEDEMDSMGLYGVSYINGSEASAEECASYDLGGYEYITVTMNRDELIESLNKTKTTR